MKTKNICWLLAIWITLVTACTEKDELQSVKGTPVEVTCCLQVAPLGGETRGTDLDATESEISDLTVIQFDGTEDDARSMIVRMFEKTSLTDLSKLPIGLMQPQNKEKQQTLYFVANAGKTFSSFNGTLGTFKATTVSSSDMGGKILMTSSCQTVIKTETGVNATLSSRLAKIVFKLDKLPSGSKFEPLWLQLRSVPLAASPEAPAGTTYPADNSSLYTDLEPVTGNIEGGYTWYIPENRRGTGSATDAKYKNNKKPDNYCTCIYLEANYYPNVNNDTGAKRVYYTLYPGANNINDFNIEGNKTYNVTLTITGIDNKTDDSRLSVTDIPASLPGANCYMVKPNTFLTFNPHNPPGKDVDGIDFKYLNRVGTKDESNIDRTEIVWQTQPGLIRAIYYLSASGEYRIQAADTTGNALIAAYDLSNNILWSWHIWVTDYVLDDVDEKIKNISEDTNKEIDLTNDGKSRVFMWEKYVWMDRGIGAMSNVPGISSFGMHCQWGRKDPFLPANNIVPQGVTNIIPTYDAKGNRVYSSGLDSECSIELATNNPTVIYRSWRADKKQLWNYSDKTVFDPCPAGWSIPPYEAVKDKVNNTSYTTVVYDKDTKLEENRVYVSNNNMSNLFWPYAGFREQSGGAGKGSGRSGIHWTTTCGTVIEKNESVFKGYIYGGFEDHYDDYNNPRQPYRNPQDGMLGRCVKEKKSTN